MCQIDKKEIIDTTELMSSDNNHMIASVLLNGFWLNLNFTNEYHRDIVESEGRWR